MKRYKCTRPEGKLQIGINFPSNAYEIKDFPLCSYKFDENGVRSGECNQCGECCMKPYVYLPEFGKKFRDERCPYLKEIDGD